MTSKTMKRFVRDEKHLKTAYVRGDFGYGERTYEVYVFGIKKDGTPWDIPGCGQIISARPRSHDAPLAELDDVTEQVNAPGFSAFFANPKCTIPATLINVFVPEGEPG